MKDINYKKKIERNCSIKKIKTNCRTIPLIKKNSAFSTLNLLLRCKYI